MKLFRLLLIVSLSLQLGASMVMGVETPSTTSDETLGSDTKSGHDVEKEVKSFLEKVRELRNRLSIRESVAMVARNFARALNDIEKSLVDLCDPRFVPDEPLRGEGWNEYISEFFKIMDTGIAELMTNAMYSVANSKLDVNVRPEYIQCISQQRLAIESRFRKKKLTSAEYERFGREVLNASRTAVREVLLKYHSDQADVISHFFPITKDLYETVQIIIDCKLGPAVLHVDGDGDAARAEWKWSLFRHQIVTFA